MRSTAVAFCAPKQTKTNRNYSVRFFISLVCDRTCDNAIRIVGKLCLQPALVQLTASGERRKRKAFADIERSGHSKQIKHVVSVQSTVVRQAQFV